MTALAPSIAAWAVEALIASALLMALVLLARAPVRRAFGPQVAYALWALPLLRLVLPPLPSGWRDAASMPISRASETVIVVLEPLTTAAPAAAAPVAAAPVVAALSPLALIVPALIALWLVGAGAFLVTHLVRHARFCRRIVAAAEAIEQQGDIRIVTSAAAPGPLAFGLWRRTVAFPADFADRYDADERALALAHEVGHHRRGDLAANWAALVVLAIHWFNPLAWRAFRAFRADQELANDARVLAGRSAVERHIYACAIVKAAHGGAVSAACHLHTITDLKGRLKMLSLSPASRRRLASGGAAVGALVVAGLGLTASGSSAAAISAGVKEAVAQAVPPAPPVPPAPVAPLAPLANVVPPAPPAPDAQAPRRAKKVVIVKDGKTQTYEGADADAYLAAHPTLVPPVPPVPPKGPHMVRKVVIVKNGKTTVSDFADIDAHIAAGDRVSIAPLDPHGKRMIYKTDGDPDTLVEVQDIPAISSAKCGIGRGEPSSMVVDSGKGPKRRIVICTDRIERVTANAVAVAGRSKDIERTAYGKALDGLTGARARIAANADMSAADRARALAAIDESITEMKAQVARLD